MSKTLAKVVDDARRYAAVATVLTAAGIAVVLATLVLLDELDTKRALTGAAIGLVGLVVFAVLLVPAADRVKYFSRVKAVTLGSVGIELSDYAAFADAGATGEPDEGGTAETLFELRKRLEYKLTYVAKHILAPDPGPESPVPAFITVGSLALDGYLTDGQARMAHDILTMREFEYRSLTQSERELFLKGASKFADTVRLEVFAAQVKLALESDEDSDGDARWHVYRAFPETARRDLLVEPRDAGDGTRHHVIPIFAMKSDSPLIEPPRKRLVDDSRAKCGGKRLLVVPPLSGAAGHTAEGDIQIVSLETLIAGLHV